MVDHGNEEVKLSFQVFNNRHSLTATAINEFISIPSKRGLITNPVSEFAKDFDEHSWWRALTGEPGRFTSASSKSSSYQHPSIRYVARLILYALFSKASTGALSSKELGALWVAARRDKGTLDFSNLLIARIIDIWNRFPVSGEI